MTDAKQIFTATGQYQPTLSEQQSLEKHGATAEIMSFDPKTGKTTTSRQHIPAEAFQRPDFTVYPIAEGQGRMWCGATILALLTGHTREKIHRDVNRHRRANGETTRKAVYYSDGSYKTTKRLPWSLTTPVKGMSNEWLEALLKKYGMATAFHQNNRYATLRRLVDDMGHFKMPIVINVTDHYVLYFNGKVYDTHRPAGEAVNTHPFGRCKVRSWWIVRRQNGGR